MLYQSITLATRVSLVTIVVFNDVVKRGGGGGVGVLYLYNVYVGGIIHNILSLI